MGLLNLLLVIPVLLFVTLVFFMRHAEEFRSHRASPFRREWTDFAKWTFREFNEYPHQFKERMQQAQGIAEQYVSSTRPPTPVSDALQRFTKFVAGSILAVLFAIALWDDTPLLFVQIQEKNLLWYLAFFGFLFAMADNSQDELASSPTIPRFAGAPLLMHVAMMRLVRCTHFLPPAWRAPAPLATLAGGCGGAQRARLCHHFARIRADFLRDFFVHRIQALAEELLGVILAPLLLIVYLPEAAQDIVEVMRRSTYTSQHLGDWCTFGCLDPWRNGSEFYGGPPSNLSASSSSRGGVRGLAEDLRVSHGGKLEKSAISFILAHRLPWSPEAWICQSQDSSTGNVHPHRHPDRAAGATGIGCRGGSEESSKSGDERAVIPLRELGTSDNSEEVQEADSSEPQRAAGAEGIKGEMVMWGYPSTALSLLYELEEFQQREVGPASPQQKLYTLFPEDLTKLERMVPKPGEVPLQPAVTLAAGSSSGRGVLDSHTEQGACSSHFFWLEVLYDFHSGQHASHLGDAGGGATFELLEREP